MTASFAESRMLSVRLMMSCLEQGVSYFGVCLSVQSAINFLFTANMSALFGFAS